ncbi:Uncharacterized protein Rs2_28786 [Raphanus sativus]|nr:Uncharacterized protein Rs2_28786 [Raphanus sativus]
MQSSISEHHASKLPQLDLPLHQKRRRFSTRCDGARNPANLQSLPSPILHAFSFSRRSLLDLFESSSITAQPRAKEQPTKLTSRSSSKIQTLTVDRTYIDKLKSGGARLWKPLLSVDMSRRQRSDESFLLPVTKAGGDGAIEASASRKT